MESITDQNNEIWFGIVRDMIGSGNKEDEGSTNVDPDVEEHLHDLHLISKVCNQFHV